MVPSQNRDVMDIPAIMSKPEAYDEEVRHIRMKQTHISWVFLTGKFAYKVKKPVNFGFLDFTTLDKRKHFCEQEVILNRRLAADMYVGALPIVKSNGDFKVAGRGEVVEYSVKMRELPEEALMSNMLAKGRVHKGTVDQIAKMLADFHQRAATGGEVDKGGSVETVKYNWDENFQQTEESVGVTISRKSFDLIRGKVDSFISSRANLLEKRTSDGRIRDCHGDLHSSSIFITDKIYIFDCIEFNDRFRHSDVVADIAFLSMDLDYHKRRDLSEHFDQRYESYSSDEGLWSLLPFYKCYRAYVRGKVACFRLRERGMGEVDRRSVMESASRYFDLSLSYARQL